MVEEIKKEDKTYYACPICEFTYETEDFAKKCQAYCKAYKSCSLEITKHAMKID